LDERGWRWLDARKPTIVEGKPKFDRPETEVMAERMLQLAELQKKGQFKSNREKDVLSMAIGSKEHGGRVRGLSFKLSIKDGIERDRARYKIHDRYKEEIVAAAENAMQAKFKDLLRATLAEQQQSGILLLNPSQEVGQQQMVAMPAPPPVLGQLSSCAQSSVASTTGEPYPVDRIMGTTLCLLLYPIGRNGKTKEVAKAQVETIVG